jgi:hypothetical protein
MYMAGNLRARFLEALDLAVTTLGDVAEGTGRAYRTLQSYQRDERRVTPDSGERLVAFLRDRARELNRAADALEAAVAAERRQDV